MAQLTIRLNGYPYTIGCKDGEEAYLHQLVQDVQTRIDRVRSLGTQGGEAWMLVMASLLMADELHDLSRQILPHQATEAMRRAEQIVRREELRHQKLHALAEHAESIAAELEKE